MTDKAAFDARQWSVLAEAPALAAAGVASAEHGGTLRESLSMAQVYAAERQRGGHELLREILASPPVIDREHLRSPEDLPQQADARLREAVGILEERAAPEELDAYKHFVLAVADQVARSHKEGGFLGIGGTEVSDREREALERIAATLGLPAP